MRARRVIRIVVVCYAVFCAILAIFLGELAFRPQRVRVRERPSAEATAARFGATLRDVSVTGSDGSHLQGWFARPARANGDAVILLHGVGDNRESMMGFAELFLSNGFAVLVPDSRAEGESGGDFPMIEVLLGDLQKVGVCQDAVLNAWLLAGCAEVVSDIDLAGMESRDSRSALNLERLCVNLLEVNFRLVKRFPNLCCTELEIRQSLVRVGIGVQLGRCHWWKKSHNRRSVNNNSGVLWGGY